MLPSKPFVASSSLDQQQDDKAAVLSSSSTGLSGDSKDDIESQRLAELRSLTFGPVFLGLDAHFESGRIKSFKPALGSVSTLVYRERCWFVKCRHATCIQSSMEKGWRPAACMSVSCDVCSHLLVVHGVSSCHLPTELHSSAAVRPAHRISDHRCLLSSSKHALRFSKTGIRL